MLKLSLSPTCLALWGGFLAAKIRTIAFPRRWCTSVGDMQRAKQWQTEHAFAVSTKESSSATQAAPATNSRQRIRHKPRPPLYLYCTADTAHALPTRTSHHPKNKTNCLGLPCTRPAHVCTCTPARP